MLATLQFPGCSDLKIGVILALLLSSDTPPSSPSDVWKIIGDGVAGTSGHSLSTHGCLRAPGLLTRSSALKDPDQVLFHQGYIVHVPAFPPDPWSLGFLEAGLASRGWAEESVQYLSLVPVLCCSVPRSTEGTHFFKPSFCPLLVVFDILARFNPFWVLSFCNFIPGGSDSILVFLPFLIFVWFCSGTPCSYLQSSWHFSQLPTHWEIVFTAVSTLLWSRVLMICLNSHLPVTFEWLAANLLKWLSILLLIAKSENSFGWWQQRLYV